MQDSYVYAYSEEELAEVTANAKELEETLASARTTFENALNKVYRNKIR